MMKTDDQVVLTYTVARTQRGKKYSQGSRKKVAKRITHDAMMDASCVLAPTSPLIRDLGGIR